MFSVGNKSYGLASFSKTLMVMFMLLFCQLRFAEVFNNEETRRLFQPVKKFVFEIWHFFKIAFVKKLRNLIESKSQSSPRP
jgi:hypothetical protein